MADNSEISFGVYFETRADAEAMAETWRKEHFGTSVERPEHGESLWKITVSGDKDRVEALIDRVLQNDPPPAKVTFPEDVTTTTFLIDAS